MLFLHCVRRAASRAACTAGNSNDTRMLMIEITTNSSISVNPARFRITVPDSVLIVSVSIRLTVFWRLMVCCDLLRGRTLLVADDVFHAVVSNQVFRADTFKLPMAVG